MFATPETQLFKNQYDALFETTENNPYLVASTRASKNKALKTSDKKIIGAINELKQATDTLNATVVTTLASQNKKIGYLDTDQTLHDAFEATGFDSLADGLIKLNTKVGSAAKNIVFVFPKINTSTVFPELFIPFDMHITNVTARFSETDNVLATLSTDVIIQLQHTVNTDPTNFTTFKEVTIDVTNGNSFVSEDFEQDLDSGIIKARIVQFPEDIKNLNIVVTATKK